ncbi:protein kintoun-like [Littorina saxatilis]|uniref:Protein kintoun n=1 Tax=Littorina saxatilis TaxID=31220 RepID=A0AAN9GC68_9CAEN
MASKTKLEDLNLSGDEIKRLGDALKDEKFREMLREYAEEISDPENRRRYEEEIAEMERERGMDVTFIKPEPGYVLKTSVNGDKKAFINISKSDKLDKPNAERQKTKDGKSGLMWHIPHSFAPPREDYDTNKNRCQVYDFVVHPDTYRMAESNARFKEMVENTAMDGIEKQFQVTLDRKNVKRPKITFKGSPSATVIRHRNAAGPKPATDESGLLKDMPYPYDGKSTDEKMQELEKEQAKKKGTDSSKNTSQGNEKKDGESTVPKYTIVHRTEVDMQEYRNAPDAKPSTRPRELVIKIELPLLKAASQASLDIYEKQLLLESKAPAAYKLDLPLPYPVDDSEGSAKFDKQKRTLTVTLPVIPDKSPALPTFANGTSAEEGDSRIEKPLIEVLSNGTTENLKTPQENRISGESDDSANNANGLDEIKTYMPSVLYTLPDFSFTQDAETVSFVLKVKNVSEDSVRRTSSAGNEMRLIFTSHGEGGFPLHFSLFLRFAESCQVANEHCSVDVAPDNVVLLLLKERSSRGLWDCFWAGLDSDNLEERLFLTVSNLQQQLADLDQAAGAAEQMATSPDAAAVDAADCPPCDLEVTAMNNKKLTIKISKKFGSRRREEEEADEYDDPPSSADIEVVHTRPSVNLHGILKQRTVSESSEDFSLDPDSPRSPEADDELSSSLNSGWKRRSVSFSEHIDKATFKTSASVNSMKTLLKSKRKRQRKWEEKTDKVSSRRRHNSTGSEGSGDDHTHSMSDSHSHSDDEEKGQGEQGMQGKSVCARLESALDFRTKPTGGKPSGVAEPDSSEAASTPSNESSKSNLKEKNVRDSTKEAAVSTDKGASPKRNNTAATPAQSISAGSKKDLTGTCPKDRSDQSTDEDRNHKDVGKKDAVSPEPSPDPESNKTGSSAQGSTKGEESLAAKIKSKLAETSPEKKCDDSDDEEGKGEETTSSAPDPSRSSDAVHNQHKTECAFNFSNDVMFDLDVE